MDVKGELFAQLGWHWDAQLRPRMDGLTDDEYFWEPAPGCWTVRRVGGRWRPDGGLEPEIPPVTTIAWRLCHIGTVLCARASFHFGDRSWSREGVSWPGTAADALAFIDRCWAAWKSGVDALSPEDLERRSEGPPGTLDARFLLANVIQHVNREVIHHGAEVALLRDLWRATRVQEPFVVACLRGDGAEVETLRSRDPAIVDRTRSQHPDLVLRAVERGNLGGVRLLADLGFDVNRKTTRTPLHHAAGAGNLELVRLLVDLGADPSVIDEEWKTTPLGWAEYFEHADVAEYLAPLTPNG